MTIFSTRYPVPWSLTAHSRVRSCERHILQKDIFAVLTRPHWSRESRVAGSIARVLVGEDGIKVVVDPVSRTVITVYRTS